MGRGGHGGGGHGGPYSPLRCFGNIFIAFIGAGILGMPYAFSMVSRTTLSLSLSWSVDIAIMRGLTRVCDVLEAARGLIKELGHEELGRLRDA